MQTLTRLLLYGWSGFACSCLQLASCHHQAKSQYSIKLTYEKYKLSVINIWGNTVKIPVVDWNTLARKRYCKFCIWFYVAVGFGLL